MEYIPYSLVRLFDHDHVTLANITCFFVDFRCPMMTKRFLFDPGLPTSHGVAHVFLCNGKGIISLQGLYLHAVYTLLFDVFCYHIRL